MYIQLSVLTTFSLTLLQVFSIYQHQELKPRLLNSLKDGILGLIWPITIPILSLVYVYHGKSKVIEYLNPWTYTG